MEGGFSQEYASVGRLPENVSEFRSPREVPQELAMRAALEGIFKNRLIATSPMHDSMAAYAPPTSRPSTGERIPTPSPFFPSLVFIIYFLAI